MRPFPNTLSALSALCLSARLRAAVALLAGGAALAGQLVAGSPALAASRPGTPSGLRATAGAHGSFLTWTPETTTSGFQVAQGTNSALSAGRVTRAVGPGNSTYTPYGLTRGRTYWFRVRALNGSAASGWSAPVSLTPTTTGARVVTMTYNLLANTFDGTRAGGQTVAPWAQRRSVAAALVREQRPDVISVQEGSGWVGSPAGKGGTRMVDDLVSLLPGYRVARTEVPPSEPGYFRTGVYVVYRTAALTPAGAGGHWSIGDGRYAAYQSFRTASGGTFLFTATHLYGGDGRAYDDRRRGETSTLVRDATGAAGGEPIVYAGDFNSNDYGPHHAYNAAVLVMRGAHVVDTRRVSIARYNDRFNSANQYFRVPPQGGYSIDYVFTSPGIAVASTGVALHLTGGRFVGVMPSDHNPVYATVTIPG